VLRWARANECPWDERTCAYAAERRGNLEVLKWLREHGRALQVEPMEPVLKAPGPCALETFDMMNRFQTLLPISTCADTARVRVGRSDRESRAAQRVCGRENPSAS